MNGNHYSGGIWYHFFARHVSFIWSYTIGSCAVPYHFGSCLALLIRCRHYSPLWLISRSAFSRLRSCLIMGPSGIGKSSLLRRYRVHRAKYAKLTISWLIHASFYIVYIYIYYMYIYIMVRWSVSCHLSCLQASWAWTAVVFGASLLDKFSNSFATCKGVMPFQYSFSIMQSPLNHLETAESA